MLQLIKKVETSGLTLGPSLEPLHLLFKWNTAREPNTVALHRQLAEEQGSVWWGRFGQPGTSGMGKERLADLQRQLEATIPTHVFLYRCDELWQCRLQEVTNDAADVDTSLLPTYYQVNECNLFVRISDSVLLSPDWPVDHIVLATNADPSMLRGALSNQTTPLFVYERFMTGQQMTQIGPPDEELTIEWLMDKTGWSKERLERAA
jgi:hypothetical protein